MKKILLIAVLMMSIQSFGQIKISQLPPLTGINPDSTDVPVNQSGITKKARGWMFSGIKTVYVRNDSIFYQKNGVELFAYKKDKIVIQAPDQSHAWFDSISPNIYALRLDYVDSSYARNDSVFFKRRGVEFFSHTKSGAGATWGSITGTLSSQTDLQNALNLKANQSALVDTAAAIRAAIGSGGGGGGENLNATMALGNTTTYKYKSTATIETTDSVNARSVNSYKFISGGAVVGDSNKLSSVDTILVYGNSVAAGQAASTTANRWTDKVAADLNATLVNNSLGSTQISNFLSSTLSSVPNYRASIRYIFFNYDINEARNNYGAENYFNDYKKIIDSITINRGYPKDRVVIVSALYLGTVSGKNNDTLGIYSVQSMAAAKEKGVLWVDCWGAAKKRTWRGTYMDVDSVHLNDNGHDAVAQEVLYSIPSGSAKLFGNLKVNKAISAGSDINVGALVNFLSASRNISGVLNWGNSFDGNKLIMQDGGTTSTRGGLGYKAPNGTIALFGRSGISGSVMIGSGQDASTMTTANAAFYITNTNLVAINGNASNTGTYTAGTGLVATTGNIEATNGIVFAKGTNATFQLYDRTGNTNAVQLLMSGGNNFSIGGSNLNGYSSPINIDAQYRNVNIGGGALGSAKFEVEQKVVGPGTVSVSAGGTTVTGTNTQFTNNFKVGDNISFTTSSGAETKAITAIASNTSMTTDAFTGSASSVAYSTAGGKKFQVYDNGNVLIGGTAQNSCAILSITSTTQGVLLPRMTKTQRDAIASPVAGTAVYQTDNTPGLRVYNGTNWMRFTETAD